MHITKSKVSSVAYLPKVIHLRKLILPENHINQFPDLTNASSTLIELDLFDNGLEYIHSFPQLAKLQQIYLNKNNLVEFPDLSNTGSILFRLELDVNNIKLVPEALIASLVSLTYLDLGENPLVFLPQLSYINNTIELLLSEGNMSCDWHASFIKTLETHGKVILSGDVSQCNVPGLITCANWSDLIVVDLVNETG